MIFLHIFIIVCKFRKDNEKYIEYIKISVFIGKYSVIKKYFKILIKKSQSNPDTKTIKHFISVESII